MDLDLFDDLDDDELLSSVCFVATEAPALILNSLPEFNCSGEDSLNAQLSENSFVKNAYLSTEHQQHILPEEVQLTNFKFLPNSLTTGCVGDFIFNQVRMYIQSLVVSLKRPVAIEDELSYYDRRREVTLLLHLIHSNQNPFQMRVLEPQLRNLRQFLNVVTEKSILDSISMANSPRGNQIDSPAYHLLHGAIEWKLIDLLILCKYESLSLDSVEENPTDDKSELPLTKQIRRVFEDLFNLSICLFKRKSLPDLLFSSAFPCTCVKESWLILQLLIEKLENGEGFWKYYNNVLKTFQSQIDKIGLDMLAWLQFKVWMLKNVSRLQGFKSNGNFEGNHHPRVIDNYDDYQNTIETFLKANPSEEHLRIFLCTSMPVFLEWWSPKADVTMILWEHFHKKLNSPFFVAGSNPSNLAVTSSTGRGYLDKIKARLEQFQPDANKSSFVLFTIILGKTIERFIKLRQNNQINKILGRIFSKFSLPKFIAMNEYGMHNLMELFLTLAISSDLIEIGPKLKDKLLSIPLQQIATPKQVTLVKGHVSILILFAQLNINISDYSTKLLEQLNSIKNEITVCKVLADGLYDIFQNENGLDKGEHLLIDTWLPNFLQLCTPVEQERSLEALHLLFNRIQQEPLANKDILNSLNSHILPFVKQHFATSYSPWIPQLAADFCAIIPISDQLQFERVFKFFIEANCLNKQSQLKVVLAILQTEKRSHVDSTSIIQIWLRSLVLLSGNNEDVVNLTKHVCSLNDFHEICDKTEAELLSSKEPLCVFVASVGASFENTQDFRKKRNISDKFNGYIKSFEKWILDKTEKSEIMFRFYSFIAIVIYNCASIVYEKSKVTCFFHIALTRFIMPTTIQMGKPPEGKLAQIIHKIWPVVVQGIGKMNYKTDPYITKTLNDLIVKWTPHFKFSQNTKVVSRPFVTCLNGDNDALSMFVLEKLTSMFLAMQRRQADPNACLVITIFQEIVEVNVDNQQRLAVFLKASCMLSLEHIMMVDEIVPSRKLLLQLFQQIIDSESFKASDELKSIIIEHLKLLAVKHLSYFTFFYFELLNRFVNMHVGIVENIMDFLSDQIRIVEDKRGGGQDNRLRTCLEKLKGSILAAKSKRLS